MILMQVYTKLKNCIELIMAVIFSHLSIDNLWYGQGYKPWWTVYLMAVQTSQSYWDILVPSFSVFERLRLLPGKLRPTKVSIHGSSLIYRLFQLQLPVICIKPTNDCLQWPVLLFCCLQWIYCTLKDLRTELSYPGC